MDEAARAESPDWGVEPRPPIPAGAWAGLALVGGIVGVAVAAGAYAIAGLAAAGVAALLALGAAILWVWLQPRRLLRAVDARPLDPVAAPRLANLAAGIAADLGMQAPSLWVAPGIHLNALVCRVRGARVVVGNGLLAEYSRTELEAVVAHCLVRLARSSLWRERLIAALGPLAGPLCPSVGPPEDVAAASVTCYPPGLAAALRRADPARRLAAFYFVGVPPAHEDPARRADLVADL